MKRFFCACGSPAFFGSTYCIACSRPLGFDPGSLQLLSLELSGGGRYRPAGDYPAGEFHQCKNRPDYDICNWLVPADSGAEYCVSCSLNEVIPALESGRNRLLWGRLENAKRRLIYTLLSLGLPLQFPDGKSMTFRFLEDKRTNPNVSESFVFTGHMGGTITINVAEAEDSVRHAVREDMQERYRTLLGHFRHESAHFYFDPLVAAYPDILSEFRGLFGDEREDYDSALKSYYDSHVAGSGWQGRYVSRYASSHPWEDWAETWAHYLHIRDTLETAVCWDMASAPDTSRESNQWMDAWMDFSVVLNELNRSMGVDDAYPFVLSDIVIEKLIFVHRRVVPTPSVGAISAVH